MEQNKVRTYLLYAFGEILLVVIGILIALQVNNWKEAGMDHERAQAYRFGDLHLIGESHLRSDLATNCVMIAERHGAGMYQFLPEYRETIRSLLPSKILQYYWQACLEGDLVEQRLKPCPSPMEDTEAALEDVIKHDGLISGLRFWVDTL